MIIVESVVGNAEGEAWKQLLVGAMLDYLDLDQWQAQKNRFRATTTSGVELALSLERNTRLRDGDILTWDPQSKRGTIARIDLPDVLVIDVSRLLDQPTSVSLQTCIDLGYTLGNQRWPNVVKDSKIYVALTVARQMMASVMKTHAFSGIAYEFVPGTEVIPYLTPHEVVRLFSAVA